MKLGKSSIVASHSFITLSALVLKVSLEIYGIEGVTGLTICVGIRYSLVASKPAESTTDAE